MRAAFLESPPLAFWLFFKALSTHIRIFFNPQLLFSGFKNFPVHTLSDSSRKPYPERKSCGFKNIRIRQCGRGPNPLRLTALLAISTNSKGYVDTPHTNFIHYKEHLAIYQLYVNENWFSRWKLIFSMKGNSCSCPSFLMTKNVIFVIFRAVLHCRTFCKTQPRISGTYNIFSASNNETSVEVKKLDALELTYLIQL